MERVFAKFGKGKILPFIELGRPWNGLIVVVLSILGAFWSKSQLDYLAMGILALVVFLIYNGSASLNDIYDDKIDAINMPYRPLQRGAFSLKSATIFCVTSYSFGNLIALFVSPLFLIAIVGMSAISILYSSPPFSFKNRCFIGNLTLAFVSVVTTIYAGHVFATGSLFMPYILFSGAIFLMILFAFFSLLKDFKDFYGDRAYGKNTLATLYGIKNASKVNIIGTSIFFPVVTTFWPIFLEK